MEAKNNLVYSTQYPFKDWFLELLITAVIIVIFGYISKNWEVIQYLFGLWILSALIFYQFVGVKFDLYREKLTVIYPLRVLLRRRSYKLEAIRKIEIGGSPIGIWNYSPFKIYYTKGSELKRVTHEFDLSKSDLKTLVNHLKSLGIKVRIKGEKWK